MSSLRHGGGTPPFPLQGVPRACRRFGCLGRATVLSGRVLGGSEQHSISFMGDGQDFLWDWSA